MEENYNDDEPALADALDGEFGDERVVVPPHGANGQQEEGIDDNDDQHHEPEATVLLRNLDKAVTAKDLLLVYYITCCKLHLSICH